MKSLKQYIFEYKTKDEITIKCEKTNQVIDPEYTIYDKSSLDAIIQRYKNDKDNWQNKSFYFIELKGKDWVAHTNNEYKMDIYRMTDSFLKSSKDKYSYDDSVRSLEEGDKMLIVV